jgi:hypothetical protein
LVGKYVGLVLDIAYTTEILVTGCWMLDNKECTIDPEDIEKTREVYVHRQKKAFIQNPESSILGCKPPKR